MCAEKPHHFFVDAISAEVWDAFPGG